IGLNQSSPDCNDGEYMKRVAITLIAIFFVTALAASGYALATNSLFGLRLHSTIPPFGFVERTLHQGIGGNATIANVSPVCSVSGSQSATGPSLVIRSSDGKTTTAELSWNLVDRCALIAEFRIPLQPGTYSVTLAPCSYLGCKTLPVTVKVDAGAFAAVNINIVTGIY
ncbi:hypothetical protein J2P12_05565, partial [Candidatus Bathyarchaeota archaeon]|nr:hypothetical protein [Candidatus Bathyarchaeota archaeon]